MEGIINRILEIDKSAEDRLANARIMQQKSAHLAFEEAGRLEEKLKKQADAAIAYVEKVNDEYYGELSIKNGTKYAEEVENLNSFYQNEHQRIETEIFEKIVGELS